MATLASATEAEKYEVLEKIGQGSFGVIRKVRRKDNGQIMCRKEISYSRMCDKERNQLYAELSILQSLKHPNIVGYHEREHLKASHDLYLYMEFCGNGDLGGYIKNLKQSGKFADEAFVWAIFAQLVSALYRCHYGEDPPMPGSEGVVSKGRTPGLLSKQGNKMILHRDLKPENVFLGENNSVKLGDFGLSKIILQHDFASTYVGTPFYMSPEICQAERYSHHSDIWALGCVMYELCAREPPFNARSHFELNQKIKLARYPALPKGYSNELGDVISQCLRVDWNARPDTAMLLNVPRIKVARTKLEGVNDLAKVTMERDQAVYKLSLAQKQITDMQAEVKRLQDQGKHMKMEWEVKATLAINERVQRESQEEVRRLQEIFQAEVERRVESAVSQHLASLPSTHGNSQNSEHAHVRSSTPPPAHHRSLQTTATTAQTTTSSPAEDSLGTDLTSLSLDDNVSPVVARQMAMPGRRKSGRTPFTRARTFANCNEVAPSPMDVQMADPSPMSIKGLSLSPRRNGRRESGGLRRNLFASRANTLAAPPEDKESEQQADSSNFDDDFGNNDDDDDAVKEDSPSRPTSGLSNPSHGGDPFKVLALPPTKPTLTRPNLLRQKTMPVNMHTKLQLRTNVFTTAAGRRSPVNNENRPPSSHPSSVPVIAASPQRKIAGGNVNAKILSPSRKAPPPPTSATSNLVRRAAAGAVAAQKNNGHVHGRTLVELQQARSDTLAHSDALLARVELSPAKWCAEVHGDEMPSPFLAKKVRVHAFR